MKTLKFRNNLVGKILSGEKTSTWRLFDDKNLQAGDEVEFINKETGEVFAKVVLTKVIVKRFQDLQEEDWAGHEKYPSNEVMYKSFSADYGQKIDENTELKLIDFTILDKIS